MKLRMLLVMNPSKVSANNYGLGCARKEWRIIRKVIELNQDVERLEPKHIKSFNMTIASSFPLNCLGNFLNYETGGRITNENIANWLSSNNWNSKNHKFLFEVIYDTSKKSLEYLYKGKLV